MIPGLTSIISPTFNHAPYIAKCIDSVIAQTNPHWEMIIIDDASTDGTGNIVKMYDDSRIRYILQDKRGIDGLATTYNIALQMARGEFVAILEGDDWWPNNKLELQVDDFKDKNVVLSFGMTQETDESGVPRRLIPTCAMPEDALLNSPVGRACRYLMDMEICTFLFPVSVMIRKSVLLDIGGFHQLPFLPLVDYPTFMHLARMGKFSFHPIVLGYWRRHSASTTKNKYYLINEGVYDFQKQFQQKYRYNLPISVTELQSINRVWKEYKWHQWFTLGRLFLVDGEWAHARKAFSRCSQYAYNWKHPALLLFCNVCCRLQRNIENFIKPMKLRALDETLSAMNRTDISLSKAMIDEL